MAENRNKAVTPARLRRVAGDRYFGRGEAYFAEGAVKSIRHHEGGVKAVVQGTHRYRVHLWADSGELGHDCNCPIGYDGAFCKHCVAVGLAWHAGGAEGEAEAAEQTAPSEGDVRRYLLGLPQEALASLILELAEEDERLDRKLTLRAAQASPGNEALSVWQEALDSALEGGGGIEYQDTYDYARGVGEVVDSLEDALQAGRAEGVIELAEYGLEEIERSLEQMDDSDGYMGDQLHRLKELHLEACRAAPPEPVDLAEWLLEAELSSHFDTFYHAVFVYADILGEKGLAAYHRLAEAEWAKFPPLGPGEKDPNPYGRRSQVKSIMAALAKESGDFDSLLAIKSRDLSAPRDFLEIARHHLDAGDADRALGWAERGWEAFPGKHRDEGLRDFIANAYQAAGRHDEAMALVWAAFAERPGLQTYRLLKQHGQRTKAWANWREKALALVRADIADEKKARPNRQSSLFAPSSDHTRLVEMLLDEGDGEAAWREAKAGGCLERLWLQLAQMREQSHPEDAVEIYQRKITAMLRHSDNAIYGQAVEFLEKIEAILARSGKEAAFRPLLTELRATHRRKRNLMKLLDRKGW